MASKEELTRVRAQILKVEDDLNLKMKTSQAEFEAFINGQFEASESQRVTRTDLQVLEDRISERLEVRQGQKAEVSDEMVIRLDELQAATLNDLKELRGSIQTNRVVSEESTEFLKKQVLEMRERLDASETSVKDQVRENKKNLIELESL